MKNKLKYSKLYSFFAFFGILSIITIVVVGILFIWDIPDALLSGKIIVTALIVFGVSAAGSKIIIEINKDSE